MRIADVLATKGDYTVVTIRPDASVRSLLDLLASHGIGAVVVSDDGNAIDGIVSERDVVRGLAERSDALEDKVSALMTPDVHTVAPEVTVADLAAEMTERRIRHVPVVRDGELVGLVSIGDVVKHRISQLQDEANHLQGYINQ